MIPITIGMTGAAERAAFNSLRKEYNVSQYGAVPNSGVDETTNIQSAINAVFTAGGGVIYFPVGVYLISGALQTNVAGIDYNSQLYIPSKNFSDTDRTCVTLKGEFNPNMLQSAGIGGAIPTTTGTILRSTILSNISLSYIIASKGAATNYLDINYNQCNIENIQFQYTADGSSKCTIGAVGFNKAANAIIKNTTAFPYNLNLINSGAALNNATGIAMPAINDEYFNVLENCNVGGFNDGYLLGEHTVLNNVAANCCLYGFNFGANYHVVYTGKISAFWCANCIRFTGFTSYVKINGLQTEWYQGGKWYDSDKIIVDASDYGHGEIHYDIVESGVGFNNARFSKTGGANLQYIPIAFTAASSFTVTGARDESEGALKDLIAKLVAKGIIVDGTTAS